MTAHQSSPLPRLLLANLAAELEFPASVPPDLSSGAPQRMRQRYLPQPVQQGVSRLGSLMRVFGTDADLLWTPTAIGASMLAQDVGLACPALNHDPLAQLPACAEILCWADTATTWTMRRRAVSSSLTTATPVQEEPIARQRRWIDSLWSLIPKSSAAAARANHRSYGLKLREQLGCVLPGSAILNDLVQLEAHLATGATGPSAGRWVLKAAWSAAGRDRLLGQEGRIASERQRLTAKKLFERHQTLIFEPWMPRIADFGACALVEDHAVRWLGWHELHVNAQGGFVGITLHTSHTTRPALSDTDAQALLDTTHAVGHALRKLGYRGPFGLDAWSYLAPTGQRSFQPLGEINARLTMGFVARALLEHLQQQAKAPSTLHFRIGQKERLTRRLHDFPLQTYALCDTAQSPCMWLELT